MKHFLIYFNNHASIFDSFISLQSFVSKIKSISVQSPLAWLTDIRLQVCIHVHTKNIVWEVGVVQPPGYSVDLTLFQPLISFYQRGRWRFSLVCERYPIPDMVHWSGLEDPSGTLPPGSVLVFNVVLRSLCHNSTFPYRVDSSWLFTEIRYAVRITRHCTEQSCNRWTNSFIAKLPPGET